MGEKMTFLWDSHCVDQVLGGGSSSPWACSGISIDTRTLHRGDLFVALKSPTGDGHAHLQDAAQRGAAAVLVSGEDTSSLPTLRVGDTLQALEKLGVAARTRASARRIAVTGSVGKTSTKDMLKIVLKDQGPTHGSLASYNNQWGVPLTLACLPQEAKYAIFEIGMNHGGEIRPLSQMVKPEIAIITAVEEAHAEFFKSIEDIALAKAEIFEGMVPGGTVILNQDNACYDLLYQNACQKALKIYSFGRSEKAGFRLLSWGRDAETSKVTADIAGQKISYSLPMPGLHWVLNSLAVLGAVYLAGADLEKAAKSLGSIEPASGRGGWHKGSFTVIDESYNANPASMRAALNVLGYSRGRRKVAVLGDMREMGELSREHHEGLLDPLLENQIDLVFCCGPYMAYLYKQIPDAMRGGYAPTSLELIPLVLESIEAGDIVSVKGSFGTAMKPLVDTLLDLQKTFHQKAG